MRNWPWFWELVGGKFVRHPKLQTFTIKVKDSRDISTAHLPKTFSWTDEFYFVDHMPKGRHILLAGDLTTLDDPAREKYPGRMFGDEFPDRFFNVGIAEQNMFGVAAGMGDTTVRDLFRNLSSPKVSTAQALANAMGMTVDEVISLGDGPAARVPQAADFIPSESGGIQIGDP